MNNTNKEDIIRCTSCRLKYFASEFGKTRLNNLYKSCKHCRNRSKLRHSKTKQPTEDVQEVGNRDEQLLRDLTSIVFDDNHITNIIHGITMTLPQRQILHLYRDYYKDDQTKASMIKYIDDIMDR